MCLHRWMAEDMELTPGQRPRPRILILLVSLMGLAAAGLAVGAWRDEPPAPAAAPTTTVPPTTTTTVPPSSSTTSSSVPIPSPP